ncbi:LysR family transcriptional regulator [Lentilactobacillus sunkii]|uniref:LysR family transcriptional regulator n=1 Tax=Lentilactobacillus sunkii DSM 19904 TaxID=1423808 RepID=A0A0R1KSQ0_9LACO|nr:LysR family transcriptional regulator [Lentilactobacillus sunkii]KRK86444.1 LysR family transcriptional regulator [Lentilactobacillus sunkii DSM 19904]
MFKFLETFMVVYKTRSFSLAAQQLFITQPTVSNQIKQLELQLHTELFERKSRREIVPTEAANLLHKRAGKILKNWQDVNEQITRLGDEDNEKVKFGISQTISRILFAKIANKLVAYLPNLDFDVTVSNSEGVLSQLETYKIDIGLIEKPLVTESISRISIGKDQLVKAGVDNGNWITREPGSGIGYYTEQYFREADIQPDKLIHVNNSGLIRRMVAQGVGQALLSDKDLPTGVPVESLGEHFSRDFYLLVREENSKDEMLNRIIQTINNLNN